MRTHDVTPFKETTRARPSTNMNKPALAALRRMIGDDTHRPLNALRDTTFNVSATCPHNGVQIVYGGRKVWIAAYMLQPA